MLTKEIITKEEDKVLPLINQFKLNFEFNWTCANNKSIDLPYHNYYHMLCMIENCYIGARRYCLPWISIRNLLIAAIFHDFNHSGGKKDDAHNIREALKGLNRCLDDKTPMGVVETIRATQYPYQSESWCIEQQIIRDCDLLQSIMPAGDDMIITRLGEEMGKTRQEMLKGQVQFLRHLSFHTDWAEETFRKAIATKANDLFLEIP